MIPRLNPNFNAEDLIALFCSEKNDKDVDFFEKRFASFSQLKYAIAYPYARMAFYAALKSLPTKNKVILMPAYTCVVMADIAVLAGFEIQFLDIDEGLIVPAKKIMTEANAKTGVLLLTDLFGNQLSFNEQQQVMVWAKENNIMVIEDKAMNLSSENGQYSIKPQLQIYSFMLNKQISSLFGGMICTDDEVTYQVLQKTKRELFLKRNLFQVLSLKGFFLAQLYGYGRLFYRVSLMLQEVVPSLRKLVYYYNKTKPIYPEGAFFTLTNFQARIGSNQLTNFNKNEAQRKSLFERYTRNLSNTKKIEIPKLTHIKSYPYFSILVPNQSRFIAYMKGAGVDVEHIFEYCIPDFSSHKPKKVTEEKYPVARRVAKGIVNLPLYSTLTSKDVDNICNKVIQYFTYRKT